VAQAERLELVEITERREVETGSVADREPARGRARGVSGFVLPGSSSVASPSSSLNCVGAAGSGTRPGTTSLRALAWAASTP
jgi:hypothetical protein